MAKFQISVDKNKCIGCETCTGICPTNFELGEDGKAKPKNTELEELGCSKEAEQNCPAQAIKIQQA